MVSQNIPNLHSAIAPRSHYRAVTCRTYGKASLLLLVGELWLNAAIEKRISPVDFGVVVCARESCGIGQAWWTTTVKLRRPSISLHQHSLFCS